MSLIKDYIDYSDFFNAKVTIPCDEVLKLSLELLNKTRYKVALWPTNLLTSNAAIVNILKSMRLSNLLTPLGKRSIQYFMLTRQNPVRQLGNLSEAEFQLVMRLSRYPSLNESIRIIIGIPNRAIPIDESAILIPSSKGKLVDLARLSSATIRKFNYEIEE